MELDSIWASCESSGGGLGVLWCGGEIHRRPEINSLCAFQSWLRMELMSVWILRLFGALELWGGLWNLF